MYKHLLFDWGDTLMVDKPDCTGPMYLWPSIDLCKGVADTLPLLSKDFQCHVATNARDSTEDEIRKALRRGGIDPFISEIFCFRSLGIEKPAADYFAAILSAIDCERDAVLMVGDSWEKDIVGAQSSGIDAVWIAPDETSTCGPVKVIHHFSELLPLLIG